MWNRREKREILELIESFERGGLPFESGKYRTDADAVALLALSYSSFPRLFRYMLELEESCRENGIETETMKAVKRRPNF